MSDTKQQRFEKVDTSYAFPQLEERILEFWEQHEVFAKSLAKPAPKGTWVFYEGPPTANNLPHPGHVLTRVVKDLLPRFKTMQGYYVRRQAGWDTHGLPVELSVEAELKQAGEMEGGGPQAILQYGMEQFNQRCFASVRRYEQEWVRMSNRVAYWLDYDNAYFTFTNKYIESVWWLLKNIWDQGLMYKGYRIQWYSTLIGTGLSSHEVAQNYQVVKDPSATVRAHVPAGTKIGDFTAGEFTYFLLWTTTPWTLLSNVALCVHPDYDYVVVRIHNEQQDRREHLVLAEGLLEKNGLDAEEVVARVKGSDLVGLKYERVYNYDIPDLSLEGAGPSARPEPGGAQGHPLSSDRGWRVVADTYVTLESGTGIVHIAPAFGEDDFRIGKENNLPMLNAVDAEGKALPTVEVAPGKWFKEVDASVLADLKARGLLFRSEKYEHNYPHCYRTDAPLMSYPLESWFIRMSDPAVREKLLANNETIRWQPAHIKHGRFGEWLREVKDWSLSRDRFWGTPLPVWECESCGHQQCLGSFAELREHCPDKFAGVTDVYDQSQFNPHRPYIDDYRWSCRHCSGGTMQRVRFVIDCWFDAGSMPFAQLHYPFENAELIDGPPETRQFPADFISEAVDQTRGWFYTQLAISTLVKGESDFKSCLVLGHILDEKGRKMSKRLGNVVDPWHVINSYGADAFRWYFYSSSTLTTGARFSEKGVLESLQRFIIPLWNVYSFFTIYANLDEVDVTQFIDKGTGRLVPHQLAWEDLTELDKWILLKRNATIAAVQRHLDALELSEAARAIEDFIGQITNWYVRRSRRRFWQQEWDDSKRAAYHTLYRLLVTLSKICAPFIPFIAEELYQKLVRRFDESAPVSVHLNAYPAVDELLSDPALEFGMDQALRVSSLGHAARKEARLRVRQPLGRVTLVTREPGVREVIDAHLDIVLEELNVKEVVWAEDEEQFVTYQYKPNFRLLGPRFGERAKDVAAWFAKSAAEITRQLADHRDDPITIDVPVPDSDEGETQPQALNWIDVDLGDERTVLDERYFEVALNAREGISAQRDRGLLLALDTRIDAALRLEGLAREVVHRLQQRRKELDLEYDARVRVLYSADSELAGAIEAHRAYIMEEVLATELASAELIDGMLAGSEPVNGEIEEQAFSFAMIPA
jgi:isoleucyl-tRNA synthetase